LDVDHAQAHANEKEEGKKNTREGKEIWVTEERGHAPFCAYPYRNLYVPDHKKHTVTSEMRTMASSPVATEPVVRRHVAATVPSPGRRGVCY